MFRRVNREELSETSPILKEEGRHLDLLWMVFLEYEEVHEDEGRPYLRAITDYRGSYHSFTDSPYFREVTRSYRPLTDTPYLFLEFARIAGKKDPKGALDEWIGKHGLLGLSLLTPYPSQPVSEVAPHVVFPPREYSFLGGPGETLDAVWAQVWRANEALTFYEVALSRDEDRLEQSIQSLEGGPEWLRQTYHRYRSRERATGAEWVDHLVDCALERVRGTVNTQLELFTYPYVNQAHFSSDQNWSTTPERLIASWLPRNLLGAMYLQFYWLITSAADKSLCERCNHIIPDTPRPGRKRKPRSDTKFCSEQCQQNHYYHTKRKPKLQQERPDG